jgi:hypothetical protein
LPIFSGLFGVWADKAFLTILIAPESFYIQLRFAKVAQAFQLAMDPCRRVIESYRDYVPSCWFIKWVCYRIGWYLFKGGKKWNILVIAQLLMQLLPG